MASESTTNQTKEWKVGQGNFENVDLKKAIKKLIAFYLYQQIGRASSD